MPTDRRYQQGGSANPFLQAIQPAMVPVEPEPGDYENDEGLLVCGKCQHKKQTFFEVKGFIPRRKVPCMCMCQIMEQAKIKAAEERKKADALRASCLGDEQFKACTFEADDGSDPHASEFCRRYVDNWKWCSENNAGLMLWGDVGGGKTFFAACIANALIDKGTMAVMTTIPQLMAEMTADFGAKRELVLERIENAPLLILDDVGTERATSFGMEQAYEIINARYKAKKPLIVTTNLTMKALKETEDTAHRRLYDRIVEMCTPCKVSADGRRQAAAMAKHEAMLQQFGMK